MTSTVRGTITGVASAKETKELETRASQLELRLAGLELRVQTLIEALRKGHLQEVDDLERVGGFRVRTAELRKSAKDAAKAKRG